MRRFEDPWQWPRGYDRAQGFDAPPAPPSWESGIREPVRPESRRSTPFPPPLPEVTEPLEPGVRGVPAEPDSGRAAARAAPEAVDQAQLRRALEELESAKRRVERDAERARNDAKAGILDAMLPVLDNLDRSIAAGEATPDRALLDGIKLVRAQFEEALLRYGLERIESVGLPFDPGVHDAIAAVEVDDPAHDGLVLDEWQRGYRLAGRMLRPAKVRVGKLRRTAGATRG